ncbi:MAG: Fic family protein [Pyrinomonadaceae bacterium]
MNQTQTIEAYKAGKYEKGYDYRYFVPQPVNTQWEWTDGTLNELLEKASIKLGELNSFARLVPNIDLFIHLHVTKEAVVSSRIEGTQTTMNEALLPFEEIRPEKRDDWTEVQNYTHALNESIKSLEKLPLSSRLLRESHKILMQGVRGESKTPGKFRTSQNWIGGASLADAAFIPPAHILVPELMSDLEKFLHNKSIHVPALIRIGLAHYQFETIHPFLDGNGRVGRLLITLYLVGERILEKPLLYLSSFFEGNRTLYYDNLTKVREKNDLLTWLRYFLVGVEQTATKAVETLGNILALKLRLEAEIAQSFGKRSLSAITLLNALFKQPVVTKLEVQRICGLSKKATSSLVNSFVEAGYLREVTGNIRHQVFLFDQYIRLFE